MSEVGTLCVCMVVVIEVLFLVPAITIPIENRTVALLGPAAQYVTDFFIR